MLRDRFHVLKKNSIQRKNLSLSELNEEVMDKLIILKQNIQNNQIKNRTKSQIKNRIKSQIKNRIADKLLPEYRLPYEQWIVRCGPFRRQPLSIHAPLRRVGREPCSSAHLAHLLSIAAPYLPANFFTSVRDIFLIPELVVNSSFLLTHVYLPANRLLAFYLYPGRFQPRTIALNDLEALLHSQQRLGSMPNSLPALGFLGAVLSSIVQLTNPAPHSGNYSSKNQDDQFNKAQFNGVQFSETQFSEDQLNEAQIEKYCLPVAELREGELLSLQQLHDIYAIEMP